jgi:hypothetical protein
VSVSDVFVSVKPPAFETLSASALPPVSASVAVPVQPLRLKALPPAVSVSTALWKPASVNERVMLIASAVSVREVFVSVNPPAFVAAIVSTLAPLLVSVAL